MQLKWFDVITMKFEHHFHPKKREKTIAWNSQQQKKKKRYIRGSY